MIIPVWNMAGIIPPIRPGVDPTDRDRSPYVASILDVIETFAISKERCDILFGLLSFRQAVYAIGVNVGMQWLDGSFMEDVENHQSRPPNDMDAVTFIQIPAGESEGSILARAPQLFDNGYVKDTFKVDSYWGVLGDPMELWHVEEVTYWYSMWSHRRLDNLWKGFLQVELTPSLDADAMILLNQKVGGYA